MHAKGPQWPCVYFSLVKTWMFTMRKFAITGALCAIVMSCGVASAKNDFSALLSELSYDQPAQATMPSYRVANNNDGPEANTSTNAKPVSFGMHGGHHHHGGGAAQNYNVGSIPAEFHHGGGCADGGCDSEESNSGYCTPHNTPNLPGSTLRQYWKSNSCHSNVWDGYQNHCHKPHTPHKKKHGCLHGGCAPAATPCEAGCDVPSYASSCN